MQTQRAKSCSALCAQFLKCVLFFANLTRGKLHSHSFYQRRDAIVQGADNIMKVSNDAAKDFDKTVLAAMLKVPPLSTQSLPFNP
jgi:hypothetical protein